MRYNPKIQKVSVTVEGKPNQLYTQGMRSFEQYDKICKYFAEGKQTDNDATEIQKHLQLCNLNQSSDILQHSQNRPTGDRFKFRGIFS